MEGWRDRRLVIAESCLRRGNVPPGTCRISNSRANRDLEGDPITLQTSRNRSVLRLIGFPLRNVIALTCGRIARMIMFRAYLSSYSTI